MKTAKILSIVVVFFLCVSCCQKRDDSEKKEVINLKFSSYTMPTELPNLQAKYALDLVEKKTNGKVKIERYTAGALGGVLEELDLVSTGAVDIICLHLDQYPQQLPIHKILNADQFVDREQALANIRALTKEIPETKAIFEDEARKNNIKILYCHAMGGAGITTGFEANSLEDLKGKKINVITSYQRKIFSELGLIPVNVQIPELYEALSRGVIDAIFMATAAIVPLKWYEVGETYLTLGDNVTVSMPITLNLNTWNSLPADVQQAFLEASEETARWSIEEIELIVEETHEMFELSGVDIVDPPRDEVNKFWEEFARVATQDWLDNAKEKGVGEQAAVIQKYWDDMKWGKWTNKMKDN
jgi:TRAP-type C4-dicarboxylate transport system substrate-binding protein